MLLILAQMAAALDRRTRRFNAVAIRQCQIIGLCICLRPSYHLTPSLVRVSLVVQTRCETSKRAAIEA